MALNLGFGKVLV